MHRILTLLAAVAMVATPLASGTALAEEDEPVLVAQAAEAEAEAAESEGAIEEIIVTGRKREESIMEAPLSITALGASDLKDHGFTAIDDIDQNIPNIKLDQTDDPAGQDVRVFLRGVGQTDPIITADPGVAIYLDGVYVPRLQGGLLELADIERVEVLRGPQGTLFGKNTIGGAIQVITRKPGPDLAARATVRAGNFGAFESDLAVNIPLIEELASVRLSFVSKTNEGWARNAAQNNRFNDEKLLGGRFSLLVTPSETVELMFTGERIKSHHASSHIECNFFGGTGVQDLADLVAGAPGSFKRSCLRSEFGSDEHTVAHDIPAKNQNDTMGLSASLTWEASDNHTLKAITAWRRIEPEGNLDVDATEHNAIPIFNLDNHQYSFSQELQWNGAAMDGQLNWVAGAFWGREIARDAEFTNSFPQFTTEGRQKFIDIATEFNARPGADVRCDDPSAGPNCFELFPWSFWGVLLGAGITGNGGDFTTTKVTNLSYAVFGELSYDVTDALQVTAGLRRSQEKKEFETDTWTRFCGQRGIDFTGQVAEPDCVFPGSFQRGTPTGQRVVIDGEPQFDKDGNPLMGLCDGCLTAHTAQRFDDWSPRFNVSYDVTDDVLAYVTWAKGWKSGGFNGRAEFLGQLSPVKQEKLKSWEIGLKGTFFDNRLRMGLAGFYNDYEDIQLVIFQSIPDPNTPGATLFAAIVSNAGEATIQGIEAEILASPLPGLTLMFSGGLTNARFDKFNDTVSVPLGGCAEQGLPVKEVRESGETCIKDRKNDAFQDVPPFTYNVTAMYELPVLDFGTVRTRLTWYSVGRFYSDIENTKRFKTDKYGLLSGRIALELEDGLTEVALYGRNLLDRRWKTGGVTFETALGYTWSYWGPPRRFGIEVSREFF